jgi:Na+/melibiose symporter-like transporter
VSGAPIGRAPLLAYGALGLPLAFAALPVYVHVPKLYGDTLGMNLALVGAVLLLARVADALIDPLLGWWSDRSSRRRLLIVAALPPLALGMVGLLAPPAAWVGSAWLAATLVLVYFGFSLASVNYYAWGAEISADPHQRTRVTASREGWALLGVIAASVAPTLLGADLQQGLAATALAFLPLLALCAAATLLLAPRGAIMPPAAIDFLPALRATLANRAFRRLLAVFALNGIAAAIPATLVLFYVADVLRLESQSGLFLAVYFLCGVAALPLWVSLSKRRGKPAAWLASMLLSIAVFVWAFTLGAGDFWAFLAICALSGAALGADLALPPSMLADAIDQDAGQAAAARSGAYFGVWNFVTKLNLALAAGIALPLLAVLGYEPGEAGGTLGLSAVYALLPVVLKLAAAWLLWRCDATRDWCPGAVRT